MALGWKKDYLQYKSYFSNILNLYKKKEDLRMFLEIMLSLVTISFFSVFAIRPTLLTISSLLKDINTKKEIITKMDIKIKNLQAAQGILSQESFRIPILNLAIPKSPIPQIFVHQIEGVASTSQVQILGVRIDETLLKGATSDKKVASKEDDFPADTSGMGFSVSMTGSFKNLFSFLKNLENLRSPIKIDILGMNLSKKEEGNILTLVVTGKVPYLEEKK
ncbi:MAG: hypothetical protein AAB954_01305 [Patescibacteria group bacterium]